MRVVAVLLAGCGFQVSAGSPDAVTRDTGATADGSVDSPAIDTPPAFTCPSTFTVTVAASTSRYLINTTNAVFTAQNTACNNAMPGATHLVVFDTTQELDQISALLVPLPQPSSNRFYVGAVQMPNQANAGDGWLWFTGGAIPAAMWRAGQPDDNGDPESNHDQQLATVESGTQMNDVSGALVYGVICECDGKPIDPTVAPFIP